MKKIIFAFMLGALALSVPACDDDDEVNKEEGAAQEPTTPTETTTPTEAISSTTIEANKFVYESMVDYYYWYKEMPSLNYKEQENTEDYFYALRYSGDRFSFIYDDADAYFKEEEGISTSMGWDYILTLVGSNSTQVVAIINYVDAGTPAYKAGAKRGDVIVTVDGEEMNTTNYSTLIRKKSAKFGVSRYDATKAAENPKNPYIDVEYSIAAAEVSTSPIGARAVFEAGGHKIAYMQYNNYYSAFNDEIGEVMAEFKTAGADRLILDLRYNPGGEMTAEACLCSHIAPQTSVASGGILTWYKFNDKLSKYPAYSKENIATCFMDSIAPASLDLNSVVVLVGTNTYSASEATVMALKPYMDVYTIGSTTGGKNTTMFILVPEDFYNSRTGKPYYDSSVNNWLMAPIVAEYFNANDESFDTTDKDGFDPDFMFNEYSLDNMGELGQPDEPLTALAIEYIVNGSITSVSNKAMSKTDVVGFARPDRGAALRMSDLNNKMMK